MIPQELIPSPLTIWSSRKIFKERIEEPAVDVKRNCERACDGSRVWKLFSRCRQETVEVVQVTPPERLQQRTFLSESLRYQFLQIWEEIVEVVQISHLEVLKGPKHSFLNLLGKNIETPVPRSGGEIVEVD